MSVRKLALVLLMSCATEDTSKLEARVHELEKQVAELRAATSSAR